MEPDLATDAGLLDVLAELSQREPIFHRREHLSSREDFERQTAADFWEVGASGRRYSREFVWSVLSARLASGEDDEHASEGWQATDFQLRRIARDTYLLTYTLRQGDRLTRRLTVWQGSARAGWKILFHQGTVAGLGPTRIPQRFPPTLGWITPPTEVTFDPGRPGQGPGSAQREAIMTKLNLNDARCAALFASGLQRSDAPDRHDVSEAVSRTVRRFGIRGCAGLVAQEFGDHPEAAAARMRWVRQLIGESPGWAACRAADGTRRAA